MTGGLHIKIVTRVSCDENSHMCLGKMADDQ